MLDGTLVTDAPFTQPPRTGRMMILAAVLSAVALAGCASRSQRAPVADHSNASAASGAQAAARGTYVVRAGDTLYKIAQDHGMEVSRLAQLNNISNPTQLAIGQVLRLDANTPQPSGSSTAVATPVQTKPAGGAASTTPEATGAPAPVDTTASRASDAGLVSWGWPAGGKIIQGFNNTTKGIDIEGAIGAPVTAAAAGKVMYAGNGVRGLGNLILLGHSDGFITAYAHNQSLLVKTGEIVKKGAKIATIGQSDTTSPRLHFEIRRRGTPVNPLSYLPAR
ncbi:peptidoglycan DD-metalloendopeptidase family protein [Castellaniella sp.]|uniref:peptidoglycan DD-metalloendopeptidase family protein n=1 Tax=Castellaniella sp. TaxID=1955812 RepID=UPI002B002F50|nr:peptidoglycan DD-metalloendopeptidase family protein [Castellaniella sp.]